MKKTSAPSTARLTLAALAGLAAPFTVAQTTGFNKTAAGPFDYDDTANWIGGTINGVWNSDLTLAAAQAVTFDSDLGLSTGLNFGHAGNFALTLRGDGTNRTITLGGDITVATTGGTNANLTLGSSTSGQNLNVNLGGATRTLSVATGRTLTLTNVVSNGAIEKTGAGTLTLAGANLFAGGLTLSGGTVSLNNNAALGTGTFTINNGATIAVNAARTTTNNNVQNWNGDFTFTGTNSLNLGTGAVTINGDRTVTVSGSTLTVGGAIGETGGSHSLIKTGAGTMILNGANTYTGGTVINGGILQFGSGAVPATGDITINSAGILNANNALANVTAWLGELTTDSSGVLALTGNSSENLDFSNHGNLILGATTASTYSGTLTPGGNTYRLGGGTAALTVTTALTGSGNSLVVGPTGSAGSAGTAVTLTAANTYAGATTINSGSLSLSGATGASASSAITANTATTLTFDSSTSGVTGATRAAGATLNGATLNVLGNATANSADSIGGVFTASAPSTFGALGASTVTLTPNAAANTRLTSASLARANNGAVFFRGTGLGSQTIASNTANTSNIEFTTAPTSQLVGGGGASGDKNISILPWAVGADTAGGVPTGFVTYDANGIRPLSSGEYDTTVPAATSTNNVRLDGTGLTTNGQILLTANGATTVNSLLIKNATISGSGTSGIILAGTGALTVTSGAIYADLTNGGNNNSSVISKLIDFGTVEGVIGTLGTSNSKNLSFAGGISGSGGVTIYDAGNTITSAQAGVSFGAANSYTGNTVINGSLLVGNANALPNFTNASRTGDVYVNGTMGLTATARMNGLFGNGRIITPFSTSGGLIVGDNNATSTFGGTITQTSGTITLTKVGTGTLNLTGTTSTYTNVTNVQNGTLSVVTLNNIAAPVATSSLGRPTSLATGTIGLGATTTTGTLQVVGTGETTDRVINLAGTTGGGAINQSGTGLLKFTSNFTATGNGLKTLTLTGSTAGSGEIAGAIVNSTSATSLAKTGSGTWTLSGANTYTGATTVSNGNLVVSGSIASSAATVGSGATLALSGSGTAGSVTVNSGTFQLGTAGTAGAVAVNSGTFGGAGTVNSLAFTGTSSFGPGNSPGTVTIANGGSLTLGGDTTSTFQFTDGGFGVGTFDLVTTSGTATGTIAGTLNVDFTGSGYTAGSSVTFINLSSIIGTFSSVNVTGLSGLIATVNYDDAAGDVSLSLAASTIPEPSAFAVLAGLAGLLLAGSRRRRAS